MKKVERDYTDRKSVKPRSVIEGELDLLAAEYKLFDIILAQINRSDDVAENTTYWICPRDYIKMTNISEPKNFYRMLKTAGNSLMNKTMILGDKQKGRKFCLVAECAWNEAEGIIEIELSKSAKKLLLNMIQNEPDTYTKLKYSLRLTGKYTHSLYNMLKEFENTGWRKDLVVDLRKKLCVPDSYNYGRFKKNVLVDSMAEINKKTDLNVSFIEHKKKSGGTGRKAIERIDWVIKRKELTVSMNDTEEVWIEVLLKFLDGRVVIGYQEALIIVRKAIENGLSQQQMKNRINVVLNNSHVRNFVGLCVWSMGNEFKSPAQLKQQFHNFSQRKYPDEWFRLLEKMLLCPERMTDAEQARYEELRLIV